MDSFRHTPAWTSPYSATGSTLLGDPAPVTPRPNDRTSVSFASDTGGVSGEPSTSPANPYTTKPNGGTQRGNSEGTYRRPAATASAQPAVSRSAVPTGGSPSAPAPPAADTGASDLDTLHLQIPPFYTEQLFAPLPGAQTRGVGISEWESYRTDVAGKDILVTTDDSNFFRDRNGKLNGNTGDTDASGLNVTDATDSVIYGTESADEAPWQTVAQALVDILERRTRTKTFRGRRRRRRCCRIRVPIRKTRR